MNIQLQWEVGVTAAFWGIESPARILKEMKRYSPKRGFPKKVRCPVFVSGAGKCLYFDTEEHTMGVFNDLAHLGERERRLWMPDEGGLQAKIGAFGPANMKAYGFPDEVSGIRGVKAQRREQTKIDQNIFKQPYCHGHDTSYTPIVTVKLSHGQRIT